MEVVFDVSERTIYSVNKEDSSDTRSYLGDVVV